MTLLVVSFLAGCLTVLAPCILPLLPVVVGSSARGHSVLTPYVVIVSLGLSVILFTFVLKVSTVFILVPPFVWTAISGGVLLLYGLSLFFPSVWESIPGMGKLSVGSNRVLGRGYTQKSFWGDVLIGAALGPVFSTCSPTYFVILATVLPASFLLGSFYLLAYVLGLSLVLLLIALIGERFSNKLLGYADARGTFKRILGFLFIVLGVLIMTGYEKKIETAILERGYFDVTKYEHILLKNLEEKETTPESVLETSEVTPTPVSEVRSESAIVIPQISPAVITEKEVVAVAEPTPKVIVPKKSAPAVTPKQKYVEFVNPSGFVNTNDKAIAMIDFVGRDVILVEVMTYSCINCQRTFTYMNTWYEKYKDNGLTVIGLHTPEFAYEKKKENVADAMKEFGIRFPIVLDNDYETWNAYGNRFWPRRYLIDLEGNIVFDHIGEGKYKETEEKIIELLAERNRSKGVE